MSRLERITSDPAVCHGQPTVRGLRRRVKFLVDAQLPVRLARFLISAGHDVLHTTDLPDGNRTHLDAILAALEEADFVELVSGSLVVHRRREDGPAR
jgi:hypothetical protein